jgi:tetratricopeptide (TPR) repeat protein
MHTTTLDRLAREESRRLLRRLAPRLEKVDDQKLDRIAERSGDMPLALELAGRYLQARNRLGVEWFLHELEQARVLPPAALGSWFAEGHPKPDRQAADLFLLHWQRLEGDAGEIARWIFLTASYCAPGAPIPAEALAKAVENRIGAEPNLIKRTYRRWLGPLRSKFAKTVGKENQAGQGFNRGLKRLMEMGLATPVEQAICIHPLLGELGRALPVETALLEGLTSALIDLFYAANINRTPEEGRRLRAHAEAVAAQAEAAGLEQAGWLWNELGYYLNMISEYEAARDCLERALRIDERIFGPEHPYVAIYVNNLGRALWSLGDLPGARLNFERALQIDVKAYGPENPAVAIRHHNLGNVLKALGDLQSARSHFERALRIDEKFYPSEHLSVARDADLLGQVLHELGDFPGAKRYYEQALRIDQQVHGAGHPVVVRIAKDLENMLEELGYTDVDGI